LINRVAFAVFRGGVSPRKLSRCACQYRPTGFRKALLSLNLATRLEKWYRPALVWRCVGFESNKGRRP
jgi:hypothetical protein